MALPTISVRDGTGTPTTVNNVNSGRQNAIDSSASVLANEDFAAIGALTETAPTTDTASSGLNGRLQRIAQRLTSLIGLLPASLGIKTAANSLSIAPASDAVFNATLPFDLTTPKFAFVNLSASGDVIAAVATKRIRVLSYSVVTGAASASVKFQSGGTSDITSLKAFGANAGISSGFCQAGHFQTVAGEKLNLVMTGTGPVGIDLTYIEV
jgi:hypothetical protein